MRQKQAFPMLPARAILTFAAQRLFERAKKEAHHGERIRALDLGLDLVQASENDSGVCRWLRLKRLCQRHPQHPILAVVARLGMLL